MAEILSTDIMHIGFLKKERFSGSAEGMRYRMEKYSFEVPDPEAAPTAPAGEDEAAAVPVKTETVLRCTVWPEPFCYEKTPAEVKTVQDFPFTEDGVESARLWLNERRQSEKWENLRLPWQNPGQS